MAIRNSNEFRQMMDEAFIDFQDEVLEAGREAGMEIAEKMAGTTLVRRITGNLLDSVGVPGQIGSAPSNLGLRRRLEDQAEMLGDATVRITTNVAMRYADEVNRRSGFTKEAEEAAPDIIEEHMKGAFGRHETRLAQLLRTT